MGVELFLNSKNETYLSFRNSLILEVVLQECDRRRNKRRVVLVWNGTQKRRHCGQS